jgi:bifunctional UDP-N-acetylglucosamine pyrophosphorylase/glucosamine-1-phosphate N-acetyltransferase
MAGAVEACAEHIHGPSLIVSSNDVVEPDAYSIMADLVRDPAVDAGLLAYRVNQYFPGGYLQVDDRMQVSHIVEKPQPGREPSDLVNVVVHYYRDGHTLLEAVRGISAAPDEHYELALDDLIKHGACVRAVPYDGFWSPLKRPWDMFPVMEYFLSELQDNGDMTARVSPSAVIQGAVVLGKGVRVLDNAVIRGPAYIGKNAVIGNNTLIRGGCHIGAGSVVGFGTEIKHSYIGKDCWFHSNYIGDSIIDDGCSFGSGGVTANLRFDEGVVRATANGARIETGHQKLGVIMGRGSQTGINASLFPGVMVGPHAIVGPHVCLKEDLGAGMFARPMANYEVIQRQDGAQGPNRGAMRGGLL